MRNAASIRFNDKVRFKYNNIIMEGIIKDIEYNDFGIEVEKEKDWIFVDIEDIISIVEHGKPNYEKWLKK